MAENERKQNTMAALMDGSWEGLKLAAGIATLLIAILGLVALIDYGLIKAHGPAERCPWPDPWTSGASSDGCSHRWPGSWGWPGPTSPPPAVFWEGEPS